jgi:hypothetical protein
MDIRREIYIPSPQPGQAPWLSVRYVGAGPKREETLSFMSSSDWPQGQRVRTSDDDGATWTPWRLCENDHPTQGEFISSGGVFARIAHHVSGRVVQAVLLRLMQGDPHEALMSTARGQQRYFDHMFWQISDDDGASYGPQRLIRYEDGPEFDPADWGKAAFLKSNQMYGGYNIAPLRDGRLAYPVVTPMQWPIGQDQSQHVRGIRVFFGRWDQAAGDYEWTVSPPMAVPLETSGRGLAEPVAAQLADGRILLVCRGSNTPSTPGRRWMVVGSEDGASWSDVTDLRYDDGERFYSPASMSRLVRNRKTGLLYWLGNICPQPPRGNSPRYPLVIAEVDESAVALRRSSLVVIDDRDPATDSPEVQLSNFHVPENRTTGDLEIYLTRLGQRGQRAPELWSADAYRYVVRL